MVLIVVVVGLTLHTVRGLSTPGAPRGLVAVEVRSSIMEHGNGIS